MPYKNPKKDRNYKAEYANETPERKAQRAARNRARRKYETAKGDLPTNMHVDHKTNLSSGGAATDLKNLRALPAKVNESYARNSDGSVKYKTSEKAIAARRKTLRSKTK